MFKAAPWLNGAITDTGCKNTCKINKMANNKQPSTIYLLVVDILF